MIKRWMQAVTTIVLSLRCCKGINSLQIDLDKCLGSLARKSFALVWQRSLVQIQPKATQLILYLIFSIIGNSIFTPNHDSYPKRSNYLGSESRSFFDSKCLIVKKSSSSFVLEIFDSVLIVIILSILILNCPQSEGWSNISTGQFKYS